MITAETWWSIIEGYGAQIWPFQLVFYILGLLVTGWLLFTPGGLQQVLIKLYLSIAFAWNGMVFFLILARDITGDSYGNYLFGSLFIIVSVLFVVDLVRKKMRFSLPAAKWQRGALGALLVLVFCYPLLGIAFGHPSASLIMPGTFPCPTTALGLLLLTTALPRVDLIIYILLLFWAIPFPPFIQIPKYGVYEDIIMFASGLYSLMLLITTWKEKSPVTG